MKCVIMRVILRRVKSWLIIAVITGTVASAATIVLRNGETFTGTITGCGEDMVIIATPVGSKSLQINAIRYFSNDDDMGFVKPFILRASKSREKTALFRDGITIAPERISNWNILYDVRMSDGRNYLATLSHAEFGISGEIRQERLGIDAVRHADVFSRTIPAEPTYNSESIFLGTPAQLREHRIQRNGQAIVFLNLFSVYRSNNYTLSFAAITESSERFRSTILDLISAFTTNDIRSNETPSRSNALPIQPINQGAMLAFAETLFDMLTIATRTNIIALDIPFSKKESLPVIMQYYSNAVHMLKTNIINGYREYELLIPAKGIRYFFYQDGTAKTIQLEENFSGAIDGIRIGDTLEGIRRTNGEPLSKSEEVMDGTAYHFRNRTKGGITTVIINKTTKLVTHIQF